jgi:hypothetical protein
MKTLLKLIGFAALLAGLAFLYRETLGVDPAHRDDVVTMLRELKHIDAEWEVHMLRSKTGLNKNYDPLTQPQGQALQVLERKAGRMAAVDYRLREAEGQLKEMLSAKIALVDRFKAQNAILRNSLRYIPLAADDLKARAREAAEGNPAKRAEMSALAEATDLVLIDTLKLETARDAELNAALRKRIGTLVERRGEYPPALAASFDTFLNHVSTISAQKEREEEVLEQLGNLGVSARVDTIEREFSAAFDRMLAQRDKYRLFMFAYAGFIVALLAFLLGRGSRSDLQPA